VGSIAVGYADSLGSDYFFHRNMDSLRGCFVRNWVLFGKPTCSRTRRSCCWTSSYSSHIDDVVLCRVAFV
jgi:hypothetical protein